MRHNLATRVPRAHIYLDTEAHVVTAGSRQTQSFRLAVAACDRRRHHGDGWKEREWVEAFDLQTLWDWIDVRCERRCRTVLVAHNLAYDLRISDAFTELPARGWVLKAIRLDDGQAWCSWRRDGRTLVCVDTLSWVPTSLDKLGALVGLAKCALPDWEDDDGLWLERCRRDVEILADVWRRLIAWVTGADLGNWKPTGAGQSWAAFRHRFMDHPLLVHEDSDARGAERVGAWSGRCEAWQHGPLRGGPFVEWDYRAAYARIGADCAVPIKLVGELSRPTLDELARVGERCAVLAEVEVTTDVATVPARGPDGIVWPVGTFTTTLWENEVRLALVGGAAVRPLRAWWYRRAPALSAFCKWVLELIDERNTDVDPVVKLAAKHWSRALIGRTAAQWSSWTECGRAPYPDVCLSTVLEPDAGERYKLLWLGTQLIRKGEAEENPDALVAVMSWVMAEARCRLWAATLAAGQEHVAYVDTDSVIVDQAGHQALLRAAVPGLVVKGAWESIHVLAPRQIVLEGALRAAGVPYGARQVDTDTWEGDVWSGLATSLGAGERDRVTVSSRRVRLSGTDKRRRQLPGGLTEPYRLG